MAGGSIFTREFLRALSNWQRGWAEDQNRRREIANELIEQCRSIPIKFKTYSGACYRKRFIQEGEIIPILVDDEFFEGIASWTTAKDFAKVFKGYVRPSTKFVVLFKHTPRPEDVVLNIPSLWQDTEFVKEAEKFRQEDFENSKAIFNFKDSQSEIILRSTLKGTEIEDVVGVSSSFEDLCDLAEIPEERRPELSVAYARNPNGIPIEIPTFVGTRPTREAIQKTLSGFREMLAAARAYNVFVDWSRAAKPHEDDLRHKIESR